ncbi:hypothetical protein MMC25_002861 [Agyrium rufum]|nr:hypothetical protein [Agyrium rufum]
MTRRIVRAGMQLGALALITLLFLFIVDSRYRVLPEQIHNHLPTHHPGLVVTDITVSTCSSISLLSSCNLDSKVWHKVDKDLYLGDGWFSHGYIHIQRKKEEDLLENDKIVLDVRISRLDPTKAEKTQGVERWESRPGGLWLHRSAKRHASDSQKAVTAVDVLFGADAVEPRLGWEIRDQPILIDISREMPEPRLSIRRGIPQIATKQSIHVRKDGKFKIAQISDLHLSTGLGKCRDPEPATINGHSCEADPRTLDFVGSVLDDELPDLAILSGDIVNGDTAPDAQSAVFKIAELLVKRSIPYAAIFGNHDDEGNLDRHALMDLLGSLPLSLAEAGPATVDGVGNYVVEVLARGTSTHSALTIYLLDTHGYSPDEQNFKGYDWLKKSQIEWFREEAAARRHSAAHKAYTKHHFNIAFIHIPLPEYRDLRSIVPNSGSSPEAATAPGFNSGFGDALIENDVFAVSAGHDHANDYCLVDRHSSPSKEVQNSLDGKIWMCYAGGSGFGGYGGYGGYKRRVRMWEFDMEGARVETWKRVEGEKTRVDELIVVEGGRVRTS